MTRKWRPSLGMVLGGALAGTLALALVGLVVFRFIGPEIGFRNAAILIGSIITCLTALCGMLLVRLLLRPVRDLARYAGEVKSGGKTAKLPQHFGTSELRSTGASVLEMAEALQMREATIRSYSDHVTHELKNPLSAVIAAAELLQDRDLPEADRALVRQIDEAGQPMNSQLDALRRIVRAREVDYRGNCNLASILPSLTAKFEDLTIVGQGTEKNLPLGRDGLALVIEHLVSNAEAHGAKAVTIEATGRNSLHISDDGNGIQTEDIERIFEPLYSTRQDTGGTGMGLAIVRSLLAAHGATIHAETASDGATFSIVFPSV